MTEEFNREIITDSCVLDFSARGRSNNEANPAHWEYNDITAEFAGFGWANVDGWMDTKNGQTLRFLPGNEECIHRIVRRLHFCPMVVLATP